MNSRPFSHFHRCVIPPLIKAGDQEAEGGGTPVGSLCICVVDMLCSDGSPTGDKQQKS